jgi:DUF4097 and DUF4098 domain-containing protein YvlB
MKNISNIKINGPVTVNLEDGRIVVKGTPRHERGRVIGHARVEQTDEQTVIYAKGSLVLALPEQTNLTVRGSLHDAVLKRLKAVTLEQCQGNLNATDLASLHLESAIDGHVALREISHDIALNGVMGHLSVKRANNVKVAQVQGNAGFKHIGELAIESDVYGNLMVKDAKTVQVRHLHGNISLKGVGDVTIEEIKGQLAASETGAVSINLIQGDASLKKIGGIAILNVVEGSLAIRSPGASLMAGDVKGDAYLAGALQAGGEYTIRAKGDVRTDVEGNVHFIIRHSNNVEVASGIETEQTEEGTVHAYLGKREGAATVTIETEGHVELNPVPRDEGTEEPEREHHHDHDHRGRRHRHHRGRRRRGGRHRGWRRGGGRHGGWGKHHEHEVEIEIELEEEIQRAMEEVRSELEHASRQIRAELGRAFRDADETIGAPVGDIVRNGLRELFSARRPSPPAPPPAPKAAKASSSPGNTSEEIKMILQMVANGTISPEEAERLIQAVQS